MTKEEKIESFEETLIPRVRNSFLELLDYFDTKELPSAYSACLGTYLEKFIAYNATEWDDHCESYGIKMEFAEVQDAIENIKSLDEYVEEFR